MKNKIKNKKGGFLEIIILVIIALLLMKYFGITISGLWHWFSSFFSSVLR
ncbi:MAG: hypothetical protein WCW93_02870 [Candidatus Paceibacterota bacterium]